MIQNNERNIGLMSRVLPGLIAAAIFTQPVMAAEVQIIDLTQTPCQFLESEGNTDHKYESEKKADCEAINEKTAEQRLAEAEPFNLKAGDYVFRVTNKNVPYDLGFWLRGDGIINRATLPSVSGGGLSTGATRDYEVSLKPGEYIYSCPLNTTPDYKLVVTE